MKNKIDLLTCSFSDKELEKKYQDVRWNEVSSFYSNVLKFFLIIGIIYLLSLYLRNSLDFKTVLSPLIQVLIPIFLLSKNEDFRKKYSEKFILFLPVVNMSLFHFLDFERLSNLPHIAILPIFHSVIWTSLFPFNFINSVIAAGVPFLTSLFVLVNFELTIPLMIVIYFTPLALLIFNKRKSEINARETFSKTITIDNNRKLMNKTLNRYFGDTLSKKIILNNGELKGENRWVTILFADLKAYSTITENMSPDVALKFLNEFFTKMNDEIKKFGGQPLNYIGDSVMVVFGAPKNVQDHENKALECSLKMIEGLKELNQDWDQNEFSRYWKNNNIESIKMRIGIHAGNVIVGNLGSEEMLQYSTIGDVVNVASRLEQSNKEFDTEIAFSHKIYISLIKDLYNRSENCGEITLKGRSNPTKVYTIK